MTVHKINHKGLRRMRISLLNRQKYLNNNKPNNKTKIDNIKTNQITAKMKMTSLNIAILKAMRIIIEDSIKMIIAYIMNILKNQLSTQIAKSLMKAIHADTQNVTKRKLIKILSIITTI